MRLFEVEENTSNILTALSNGYLKVIKPFKNKIWSLYGELIASSNISNPLPSKWDIADPQAQQRVNKLKRAFAFWWKLMEVQGYDKDDIFRFSAESSRKHRILKG